MITLDLEPEISEITRGFALTEKTMQVALKRSVRKLMRWIRRQVLQYASRMSGIAQNKFSLYNRVHLKLSGTEGWMWVGFGALPLHEAGRVSWRPGSVGARVAGQQYAGAFYRRVYGDTPKVWIRNARNLREGHALYRSNRTMRGGTAPGHGRFPVRLLGLEMEEIPREMQRRLERKAHLRFKTLLRHELEFALSRS
jgi:hypothetical protein